MTSRVSEMEKNEGEVIEMPSKWMQRGAEYIAVEHSCSQNHIWRYNLSLFYILQVTVAFSHLLLYDWITVDHYHDFTNNCQRWLVCQFQYRSTSWSIEYEHFTSYINTSCLTFFYGHSDKTPSSANCTFNTSLLLKAQVL